MGLFKKDPPPEGIEYRGGCSAHEMHGPRRATFRQANKDANGHTARMHGGKNPNGYVEAVSKKGGKR